MKICQTYPDNAKKLYYSKGGDIIRFKNNDSTPNDEDFYLVVKDKFVNHSQRIVNLRTGEQELRSVSCRVVTFSNACFTPGEEDS